MIIYNLCVQPTLVHTSLVLDGETRTRDREGLRTSAGVATSARDMSVGEGISDHPP